MVGIKTDVDSIFVERAAKRFYKPCFTDLFCAADNKRLSFFIRLPVLQLFKRKTS